MDNLAKIYQNTTSDTNGLDDLFQECPDLSPDQTMSTPALPGLCPDLAPTQWWTLSEASRELNVNERTLRRWIKQDKIRAAKVKGAFGEEWRIMPGPSRSGVDISPGQCPDLSPDLSNVDPDVCPPSPDILPGPDPEVIELRIKLELAEQEKAELKKQLQGATYRNGYLEAQLDAERQTIKLLTDSQHKPGWWRKFASWFKGNQ